MNVMMRTHSSNPDYNADCDYALLSFNKSRLALAKKRCALARSLHREDIELVSIEYLDDTARYFAWFDTIEDVVDIDALIDGEPVFVDNATIARIPEEAYQRTDGETMVVVPDGFIYWTCRPKHSDIVLETGTMSLEDLLRLCK